MNQVNQWKHQKGCFCNDPEKLVGRRKSFTYKSIDMKFILTTETSEGISGLDEKSDEAIDFQETVEGFLSDKDYGSGVVEFMLVLKLLIPEHAALWLGGEYYRPRKREVLFNPTFDPILVVQTSKAEWYRMICMELLSSVLRFPEIGVKNFDHLALHRDLEGLFREKGWLGIQNDLI
jgi:hypothetical protein